MAHRFIFRSGCEKMNRRFVIDFSHQAFGNIVLPKPESDVRPQDSLPLKFQ